MRIGQNPAKSINSVIKPEEVTVAVLSYIPTLGGYYAQSFDVLKACLQSIWQNTQMSYDLLVFDNASCRPVREYLHEAQAEGNIQILILSEKNYGKTGAWNIIFGAAPGNYVAYADSDVYHHPGWLAPQIRILRKYDQAGMVTGMPMWTPEEFSTATVAWAERSDGISLLRGRYLDWHDYWRHARSLGASEERARTHFNSIDSMVIVDGDCRMFVGAAHFQFVAPKSVLKEVLPIRAERPMGQVRLLDIAINNAGYLRFSTPQWWIEHMGNRLQDDQPLYTESQMTPKVPNRRLNFWKGKIPRRIVSWLYHKTFEILYKD